MPTKSNDTLSTVRIRENQRRSRNRRAELLRSLQNRVQEYERQGVSATLEMQRAARKVMQDNVRLRALLSLHGVPSEEVEAFLQSPNEPSTLEAGSSSLQGPLVAHQYQAPKDSGNDSFRNVESSQSTQNRCIDQGPPRAGSHLVPDAAEYHNIQNLGIKQSSASAKQVIPLPSESGVGCEEMQSHLESNFSSPVVGPSECANTLECFCPPPSVIDQDATNPGLEISCEAAATIIVEMRGDQDRESIRASLGCRGRETCTIKNAIVMQILDEG